MCLTLLKTAAVAQDKLPAPEPTPVPRKPVGTQQPIIKATCNSPLKDAPKIRGLALGMTSEEVGEIFGVKDFGSLQPYRAPENDNRGILTYTPDKDVIQSARLYGIDRLNIAVYSSKVFSITIRYADDYAPFENKSQFASSLSKSFNIPLEYWTTYDLGGGVVCSDFKIELGLGNSFTLTDLVALRTIQSKLEEQRKNFKP